MFGGAIGSFDRYPALQLKARAALWELHEVVAQIKREGEPPDGDEWVLEAAAWSIVHGLSILLVDDQIQGKDGTQSPKSAQMSPAHAVIRLFCAGLGAQVRR
jgi:hypothetical protein